MIIYPNAKINFGLHILKKRDDGFHEIDTLMYPIDLVDKISIEKSAGTDKGKVHFENVGFQVDGAPENNIIIKAYHLIHADFNLPSVNIVLQKNIPFGAGLGGGSADATFTLRALSLLFGLHLSDAKLEHYAALLGSDCAFFVKNKPAYARGRGEKLSPAHIELSAYQLVLVIPPVHVSTKVAYSGVIPKIPEQDLETIFRDIAIPKWKNVLVNDFEFSVFKKYPEVANVKQKLYDLGAVYTSMSGSGSAVFGLFNQPINLVNQFPDNYFVWAK